MSKKEQDSRAYFLFSSSTSCLESAERIDEQRISCKEGTQSCTVTSAVPVIQHVNM